MTRIGLALAIASCFSCAAYAATPTAPPTVNVKVTNPVLPVEVTNADPIPVTTTAPLLARGFDEPGRIPYQVTIQGALPVTPFVPAGRRLVIQHVSARAFFSGTALGMLKAQRTGLEFVFPMTYAGLSSSGNLWVGSFPTAIYLDAEQRIQFILETAPSFDDPSLQVTISGYLLTCSAELPCDPVAP